METSDLKEGREQPERRNQLVPFLCKPLSAILSLQPCPQYGQPPAIELSFVGTNLINIVSVSADCCFCLSCLPASFQCRNVFMCNICTGGNQRALSNNPAASADSESRQLQRAR
eukprot:1157402-Pelagomonas_calceolata.AAC.1